MTTFLHRSRCIRTGKREDGEYRVTSMEDLLHIASGIKQCRRAAIMKTLGYESWELVLTHLDAESMAGLLELVLVLFGSGACLTFHRGFDERFGLVALLSGNPLQSSSLILYCSCQDATEPTTVAPIHRLSSAVAQNRHTRRTAQASGKHQDGENDMMWIEWFGEKVVLMKVASRRTDPPS